MLYATQVEKPYVNKVRSRDKTTHLSGVKLNTNVDSATNRALSDINVNYISLVKKSRALVPSSFDKAGIKRRSCESVTYFNILSRKVRDRVYEEA